MLDFHITKAVYKDSPTEIVSIEEVNSGLQENVICAACSRPLIANKGNVKAHHFSHKSDDSCSAAYETQLHLTAKEFFAKSLKLPHPIDRAWVRAEDCALVSIENVRLEQTEDGKRPDLIVDIGQEKYWVEIANKHFCDSEKLQDIRELHRNLIEIDVSDLMDASTFNSLEGCKVKIQSLHHFNDSHSAVLLEASEREKKTKERLIAVRRLESAVQKKEERLSTKEQQVKRAHESTVSKYEQEIQRINVTKTNEEKYLVELQESVEELEKTKALLESQVRSAAVMKSEALVKARAALESEMTAKLSAYKAELVDDWNRERARRVTALESELTMMRNDEQSRMLKVVQEIQQKTIQLNNITEQVKQKDSELLDVSQLVNEAIVREKIEAEKLLSGIKSEIFEAKSELKQLEPSVQRAKNYERAIEMKSSECTRLESRVKELNEYCDFAIKKGSAFAIEYRALKLALTKEGESVEKLVSLLTLPDMPKLISDNIRKNRNLHEMSLAEVYWNETKQEPPM
ncbi:hypothetical protein I6Y12_004590 [Vibrio parahaemolyticus]|nr:hypothetical protein [Vibrio parahaemolyticus]EJL3951419.1 hypothetical protein [Vibrio parahaemolyticus]EKQ5822218.1 hypothetical protein [Vibrio parahaemolyticus]